MTVTQSPELILYTNHGCPWAHRAHIALSVLGLPFKEVIIDLSTPRTAEYLAINPRGLVPTLSYDGVLIPESAIVTQFLADAYPSALLPVSNSTSGAIHRAQVAFFVDAFFSKVNPLFFAGIRATTEEEKAKAADDLVAAVVKELEPLLGNAAPFYGGSQTITLVEANTGSFLLRLLSHGAYGLGAADLNEKLQAKAPAFWKWASEVVKNEHVTAGIWDEKSVAEKTKKRIAGLKK